jgi:phenylalanyl-tRNA synthetase beta chain
MGHRIEGDAVFVPGYRTDVINEVDLIEDVAIAYGFNNFEPKLPDVSTVGHANEEPVYHDLLVGLGFDEIITWNLANPKLVKQTQLPAGEPVEIENPITEDFTIFRSWLLPNAIAVLSESRNEKLPIKVYEIGAVGAPSLEPRLCIASMHAKASFSEIKGVLLSIAEASGKNAEIVAEDFGPFLEGRCAVLILDGKRAGFFGEIAPNVLAEFGLEQPVCAAEIQI